MISLFRIQGKSMEPSLKEGDFVFVNRMSYLFSFPQIGHVVVVRDSSYANRVLVKRVLAERQEDKQRWYWVEGDNGKMSTDSKHFGWVGKANILGRIVVRVGNPHHSKMSVGTPTLLAKSGGGVIHKTGPFAHDILS